MDFNLLLTAITGNGLLTVISTVILTGLIQLVRYLFSEWQLQRSKRLPLLFERVHKIYELLNVILHESPANRVCITKVSNGGTIPKVGSELFATILYEQTSIDPKKSLWQQRQLDQESIRELVKLSQEKELITRTENLQKGALKDTLDSDKTLVQHSFELFTTSGSYFYLTVSFPKEPPDDPKHREFLRSYANRISQLIKEDHDQLKKQSI